MEHPEIRSLSAKNLSHPRFQKQDNSRVREYLQDQKRRLKTSKLVKEPFELPDHEVVSKFTIPGTGFSSPILRPRTERNKTKHTMIETKSNVYQIPKVSRTIAEQQTGRNDDVSSRLEARRAKRKTRREIMKGEPPKVEKPLKNKPISMNSYSELSLLQRFPPPNIKRGRLTLKSNNLGFFRKGKTSIQILTSSGAAQSFDTCEIDIFNKQPRRGTISDSPVGISTKEIEGLDKTSKSKQIISVPKANNRSQSTISELLDPCGGTAPSGNTRPSSPVGPRPLRAYSDIWDIELDKSLPSDATSIQRVSSRTPGNTTFLGRIGSRALSPVHMQGHAHGVYAYSDVISPAPPSDENAMQEKSYDNAFRWKPNLQIAQRVSPVYQNLRLDKPYFQKETDTDFYWPQDTVLNDSEIGLTEEDGILVERQIQTGEIYCTEQLQFGRSEFNPNMLQLSYPLEVHEDSYWEEISENPLLLGVECHLGDYEDNDIALDAHAEGFCSFSAAYCENDIVSSHTIENAEGGNEFEIDANTDRDQTTWRPLFTAQTSDIEPVLDWIPSAIGTPLIGASDLWSSEKELKKLLRNHWLPQKL